MAAELKELDRAPAAMRDGIERYAGLVREIFGEHARGLTLYGAIVAGSFDPQRHTARSVLVLDAIDLRALRTLSECGPQLGKASMAAPVVMTPKYIKDSLDTFPLELLEIHQQHATILGTDHFEQVEFAEANLRLQCERELKTVLIGMRQALLAAAGREEFVDAIQAGIAENLLRTMRGMLWLRERRQALPADRVVADVEGLTGLKLGGVRMALKTQLTHDWGHFETLYRDVEKLGEVVNAW